LFAATGRDQFNRGVKLLTQGENEGAIAAFTQLIQQEPERPDAYINRGVGYMRMKEYDAAILDFEKANALNPELGGLNSNLGAAWFEKKEYLKAVDFYNKELALRPDNHIDYLNRALCWVALNDFSRGITDASMSLKLSPDYYPALCLQGDLLVKTGHSDQAIQTYEKAISLEDNHDYAQKRLAALGRSNQDNLKKESSFVSASAEEGFALQVGAFIDKENAQNLVDTLKEKGYEARILELSNSKGKPWCLIRIGSFKTRSQADSYRDKIQNDLGSEIIIRPLGQF
jgi:tetratricopeptide (TPR) repeat protein